MNDFTVVRRFVDSAQNVDTPSELSDLMEAICADLGVRHFALIHHTDLRLTQPGIININNYPPVWADYFIERQFYRIDPVLQACMRTSMAFRWSDLSKHIRLNARHRAVLDGAAREGLSEGMTVPAVVAGEHYGSCSFAAPRCSKKFARHVLSANLIGTFSFEAARRVVRVQPIDPPRLSPRQRDCILLAGQGKSNWDIGKILGISEATVKYYMAIARERYDVGSREQLVVRALLEGEISFAEMMPAQYIQLDGSS
ncbi:MAG: LuxR family transcriptional regulator [Pseudomonadota bacterium]